MIRGGLFTRYYLEDGIRQAAEYQRLDSGDVAQFAESVAACWSALEAMPRPSEAETESEFIFPVVQLLH